MITFEIPASVSKTAKVTFNIYNTLGQRVRTLYADNATPGIHKVMWNGTNDSGAALPSGIYFGILKADQFSSTIKMTLMK
jgi:flagellar hook assembly protein FlgD